MADTKLTALTELTTPAASDPLYIVDDPAGTPASKKITVSNLIPQKSFVWPAVSLLPIMPADNVPPIKKHTGTHYDVITRSFDDTTDERVTTYFKVPPDIDPDGTVTFYWVWFSTSATTGNVGWDVIEIGINEGTSWDTAGGTTTSDADAVQGATNQLTVTTDTATVSALGWTADQYVQLITGRDTGATSNMTGDAELLLFAADIPRL